MTQIELKILDDRIGEGKQFPIPSYKTVGSAGIDLYAMVDKDTIIHPNETKLISTGISIYIKDPNLCATIIPRSGLGSKNGIVLGNLVGLIDSDYQGPLMCAVWNRSEKDFTIEPGTRIAQLVILPVVQAQFKLVDEFETTERGNSGFGSTGLK